MLVPLTHLDFLALFVYICLLTVKNYLLFSESTTLTLDLFKNLDAEIGPHLSSLASEIGEQYTKTIAQYVFVLFIV